MAEGFRNDLIEQYRPLALSIAQQHYRQSHGLLCLDSLRSESQIGLIHAVRRWDGRGSLAGWVGHWINLYLRSYRTRRPEWQYAICADDFDVLWFEDEPDEPSTELQSAFGGEGFAEEVVEHLSFSPRQKQIAFLYFCRRLSCEEIGRKLGQSRQAVDNTLRKAIGNLRLIANGESPARGASLAETVSVGRKRTRKAVAA